MTDMIERVARAIAMVDGMKLPEALFPHAPKSTVGLAVAQARAAIAAMREPTEKMVTAGLEVATGCTDDEANRAWQATEYRAMIDAALNTGGRDD